MENVEIIDNATLDEIIPGDTVIWKSTVNDFGVQTIYSREGTAHHQSKSGEWYTSNGGWITDGAGFSISITIKRVNQKPPTEKGTVIVPADFRIVAELGGKVWTAIEAVCDQFGVYYGVWRSGEDVRTFVLASLIQSGTWRLDDPPKEIPF